ncbi:MAG: GGDEF domain-containing protein, partial [Acetobacteraceae bacterium]|nr:GGDEF domain-containing protein [Acetobacteraceae bacterium]
DAYGHKAGDLVLRLLGRILADSVKGRDTAARYGGEEFAVILVGADLTAASVVARQIGAALASKKLKVGGDAAEESRHLTISVGVAQARSGDTPAGLVERADAAMYAAKRAGRNRTCTESGVPAAIAA